MTMTLTRPTTAAGSRPGRSAASASRPTRPTRRPAAGRLPSPPRPLPSAGPAAPARALRLTRRGRLAIVLLTVALVVVGFSVGRASASRGADGRAPHYAVVQPGDSLWRVALRAAPSRDPRLTVAALRSLNGLRDSSVYAGQRLLLPAS